jgi:hypothetical protein
VLPPLKAVCRSPRAEDFGLGAQVDPTDAGLGSQQQALPGLVRGPILPFSDRAIRRFFHFIDQDV